MDIDASVGYRAWGEDDIAYGPVELPALIAWIKDGRVTDQSWVFKEPDRIWSRAADLPELTMFFKSKSPPSTPAATNASGIRPGSLRRIKMLAEVEERLLASLLNYVEVVKVEQFGTILNKGDHG